MQNEQNDVFAATCAMLDAAKHTVDFTCSMMRLGLIAHGHQDGFHDWVDGPSGKHLTGSEPLPEIDERARRLLARFVGAHVELGDMPGFEPAETDARLAEFAP